MMWLDEWLGVLFAYCRDNPQVVIVAVVVLVFIYTMPR